MRAAMTLRDVAALLLRRRRDAGDAAAVGSRHAGGVADDEHVRARR